MKTQSITRKNLKIIYESISESCSWRKKIQDLILWSEDKSIQIEENLIESGYKEASSSQKTLLEKYFDIETSKDLFKFNTYSKVCEELGEKEKGSSYEQIKQIEKFFNQGWIKDWNNSNQYKYTPYFEKASSGVWRFFDSGGWGSYCYGVVAYFKDKEISDFVGRTFIEIYKVILG